MRKDTSPAKLAATETERNKRISKKRYIAFQPVGRAYRPEGEQYFGIYPVNPVNPA